MAPRTLYLVLLLLAMLPQVGCNIDYASNDVGERITRTRFDVLPEPAPRYAPSALPQEVSGALLWRGAARISTVLDDDKSSCWIRIHEDELLGDDMARVLSVGGTVAVTLYTPAKTVRIRGYGPVSSGAIDKLSAGISSQDAIAGYFYFHVQPFAFFFENQPFDNSQNLSLRSHAVNTYHIVFSNWSPHEYLDYDIACSIFMGGAVFVALFSFVFAILPGLSRKLWGYFGAYWLANGLFWYGHTRTISFVTLPTMGASLAVFICSQLLMFGLYMQFVLNFIDARKEYPLLFRWLQPLSLLIIASVPVVGSLLWIGVAPSFIYDGFVVFRITMMAAFVAASLALLGFARYVPEKILGLGTLMFALTNLITINTDQPWIFGLAMVVDIVVFGTAIGLRIFQEYNERKKHEQRAERLEHDVSQARDAALRAQMNPHFVSNVINALRALVIENRNQEAYDYLTQFAHFVRVTLGSAERNTITLAEELKVLKHYVALEELRHEKKIALSYDIPDHISADKLLVPPLILQPIVENAILHGFAELVDRKPTLEISFRLSGHDILATVTDNGVGRDLAAIRSASRLRTRPSLALSIIRERLVLFADRDSTEEFVKIDDLFLAGEPVGTAVSLRIHQRFDDQDALQKQRATEAYTPQRQALIERLLSRE